jgi:hypothetical protein
VGRCRYNASIREDVLGVVQYFLPGRDSKNQVVMENKRIRTKEQIIYYDSK